MNIDLEPEQISKVVAASLIDSYETAEEYVDSSSKYDEHDIRQACKVLLSIYMVPSNYDKWAKDKQ